MNLKIIFIVSFLLFLASNAWSEVIFDGTMNASTKGTTLTGNFEIKAEYGTTNGDNLFHSFKTFNIDSNEKVTFTGPDHIKNIISRVTGLKKSTINGVLSSNMPQANFFLLNPAGLVFGENAKLDIKGSFHVSTADYLIMQNNDRFEIHSSNPVLSVSEPKTFGFLDKNNDKTIGNIKITAESMEINNEQTMSFIGGDIEITKSIIYAPEGRINIAGIQSAGEITLLDSGIDCTENIQRGNIKISEFSNIDVSGTPSGDLFIMGGDFFLNESSLYAITDGAGDGGITFIDVNQMTISDSSEIVSSTYEGNAGDILISAKNVSFENQSCITTRSEFMGSAGDISINVSEDISLKNTSIISSDTASNGNSGNIQLSAQNINFLNGSGLGNQTRSKGNGGTISLQAKKSIKFMGTDNFGDPSDITTYSKGSGNAGDVIINGKCILFKDGARIYASSEAEGKGGNIIINNEKGIIELSGVNPHGENINGFNSCFSSQSEQTGKAGDIFINTYALSLLNGAYISNTTYGDGESGIINITAKSLQINGKAPVISSDNFLLTQKEFENSQLESNQKFFSGIYSCAESKIFFNKTGIKNISEEKTGGKINISSSNLIINNQGTINTSSTGKRNAGDIFLNISDKLKLNNQASINSESLDIESGGAAGRITINSSGDISLFNDSCITTEAKATSVSNKINENGKISISSDSLYLNDSKITSSVKSGAEDGGNIDINQKMLVLNNSKISANAYEGKGGNIQIIANNFVKSQNSIIEASSEKGIDGNIYIDAPEENSNDDILVLSDNFLDASAWIQNECEKKLNNNVSRLIFLKQTASPIDLNDWISPPLIMSNNDKTRYNCNEIASGFQFFQRGLFGKAIKEWKKSLICLDNYSTDYLNVMIYLSFCYKALGRNTEAFSILNDIHNDIIKNNNNRLKSLYLMNIGDFYLTADKKSLALKNFEDALEISKTVSPVFYAYNLIYLGNILSIDQKYSKAISLYLEAVNTTAKSHKEENEDNIVNTIAYLNIAQICFVHGKYKNADKALEISLKHLNTLDDNYFKAKTLISCSLFKLKIAQSNDTDNKTINMAYEILNKVRHIGSQIENYKILSITTGYMGHIHEIFKDYSKSINLTKKAIFYCQQIDSPENLFIWQWQAGRIFKAKGDTLKAIKKYKDSIATLSFIRLQLLKTYGDNKKLFYDKVRSLHLELADIFLKQADLSLDSQTNILIKARDTIDLLKHWELQNYYQDECLNYNSNKNTNDEKITIDKNIAILYPIVFSDRVVLLITYSDELKQITCNLKNNNLLNLIERLNKKLRDVRLESRFMYYCKKLYNLLIKPIEKELENRNINTLIIASDSCLRLIPFAVLHDGKSFLFEKYALASIPGINLTNLKRNNNVNKNILLNGLAKYADPPLPGVSKELSAIKNKYKNSTLLLDKNFTLKNLTQELIHNNYSHVVIATHGVFNGSPENTYLQAFNEKISINDLERLISKLKSQTVDLLTLSACETAADDEKAALGLAGIAVKSGVKSAVATLWPVDDNASFILIKEFYNIIQNSNNSKAKALQKAQKKLFAKSEYKHPFYWSPFILIGNWL